MGSALRNMSNPLNIGLKIKNPRLKIRTTKNIIPSGNLI
jgi:hypothetical protein